MVRCTKYSIDFFPGGVVDSVTTYKIKEEMLPECKPGFH